jgi:hypothetical protein
MLLPTLAKNGELIFKRTESKVTLLTEAEKKKAAKLENPYMIENIQLQNF